MIKKTPETDQRLRVGILGAGMVSTFAPWGVLPNIGHLADRVTLVAIADLNLELAREVARDYRIPGAYPSLTAMLEGTDLDAVANLTPGPAHFQLSMEILQASKHLVTEKPLAATVEEADEIIALAEVQRLVVVCSPPDMLAEEWVLAKRLVAEGAVGKVAFARVQSSTSGPANQSWPTDPTWFYQKGAGPLLDHGVYGIHRITGVLGPAKRVVALSGTVAPVRHARGGPFDGLEIPVAEDDNTMLLLDFGGSTFAVVDATFNVVASRSPHLELFGLDGTLIVNRPGAPGPAVEVFRLEAAPGLSGWITPTPVGLPGRQDRTKALGRAVLIEHLADCAATGQSPVLSADHARHALEIMLAAQQSAREGRAVELTTTFRQGANTT